MKLVNDPLVQYNGDLSLYHISKLHQKLFLGQKIQKCMFFVNKGIRIKAESYKLKDVVPVFPNYLFQGTTLSGH